MPPEEIPPEESYMNATRLARRVFVSFIITFALARSAAVLMMVGRLGDFYLHFGGTHVHHLNYGIFILSGLGAYLLFLRPDPRGIARAAALYGMGLALLNTLGVIARLGSLSHRDLPHVLQDISRFLILVALSGVGLSTRLRAMRKIGATPFLVGFATAATTALASYFLIRWLGPAGG